MYDPRVGRWFARDPFEKSYPDMSPYAFALNTPLRAKDHDGNVVILSMEYMVVLAELLLTGAVMIKML